MRIYGKGKSRGRVKKRDKSQWIMLESEKWVEGARWLWESVHFQDGKEGMEGGDVAVAFLKKKLCWW